jgi:hypothetical protein
MPTSRTDKPFRASSSLLSFTCTSNPYRPVESVYQGNYSTANYCPFDAHPKQHPYNPYSPYSPYVAYSPYSPYNPYITALLHYRFNTTGQLVDFLQELPS